MINLQKNNIDIANYIVDWYLHAGRQDLPWRNNISPYRVWISEIMLQQTQVKTVIPYYKRFLHKFPTLDSLMEATEDEIIALWSGLGFYRRAKNIFKAKEKIRLELNGKFPKDFEELKLLPGIGESTAGAIMSIAYKKSYPILDANVKRVLSRFAKVKETSLSKRDKKLWEISSNVTPKSDIFEYTQGIMDLGATICTTKDPDCLQCPLNEICASSYNVKAPKKISKVIKIKPIRELDFTLAYTNKHILLFKRNQETFWEGLWLPSEDPKSHNIYNSKSIKQHNVNVHHKLTHLDLNLNISLLSYNNIFKVKTNAEHCWIKKTQIDSFGKPAPIKKIISTL